MTRTSPLAPRLLTLAALALVGGLATGRVELVSCGAALLAVLAVARLRREPSLTVELSLAEDRIVEGETGQATVRLTAAGGRVDQVDLALLLGPGVRAVRGDPALSLSLAPGEVRDLVVDVRTDRWGVFRVGPAVGTAYGQDRLAVRPVVSEPQTLRVLPRAEEFAAGTAHPFTRALSGSHPSRGSGDGIEPVGVRAYAPGDALRRVNWRVSARRGALHVTERRPERNAEVVLFLDTFVERGPANATTLDVAVRAAAGIADHYLSLMDRVGIVGFGGVLRWLNAGSGRVHRHQVVEHLIGYETVHTYAAREVAYLPARTLPPRALVIALSPLLDERAVAALVDLAQRGYGLLVVDTAPPDLVPPPASWSRDLSQRLWLMEREAMIERLAEGGVPVVRWEGAGSLDRVLGEVARLHSRPRVALR